MSDQTIIVSEPGASQVHVNGGAPDTVVIVSDQTASRVIVGRDSSDAINVVRPAYGNGLDGIPVNVTNPKMGDVISFNGAVFTNRDQTDLTDGGNF
ncbi:hypothetical protein [Microvirga alba]|uniref:Uncharacterized protein n=1 Tax=Microvirga alba TaxID=2791025 RepID=A0A931BZC0_9HYPH|nr:hypothetical protein [Microvirga alba]MBF9235577.1 hypothetical protein [Microvirga alba]